MAKKKINDSDSDLKAKKTVKKSRFRFWIIIFKYWLKGLFSNPLYAQGVHFFEAPSGTGKTLLANIVLQNTTQKNQFYYSNIDQFQADKQVVFTPENMFSGGKQIAKLPRKMEINGITKYANGIIFDELNASFNRRMNRTASYNDIFIGLMEMVVTHRHQGMNKLYFLGQSKALQDSQVQQVFKYYHVIYAKKRWNYELYKMDQGVNKTPRKLKVYHHIKTPEYDGSGNPIFVHFKTSKIKIDTKRHLLTYNHLGYAQKYNKLPDIEITPLQKASD